MGDVAAQARLTIVVSDASPLRALINVGRIDLILRLFTRVVIPPAVYEELIRPQSGLAAIDPSQLAFCDRYTPKDSQLIAQLSKMLDLGETEAIVTAIELDATLLLIDEKLGRQAATQKGLQILGVIGILLRAKDAGLIGSVMPILEQLASNFGFFLSPELLKQARALSAE